MKNLSVVLFLLAINCSAFAQQKADYINVMEKFMRFHNHHQSDSLRTLQSDEMSVEDIYMGCDAHQLMSDEKHYGQWLSYKFITIDSQSTDTKGRVMALFKINCSKPFLGKKYFALEMSLDQQNKIFGRAYATTSKHIDSLLKGK